MPVALAKGLTKQDSRLMAKDDLTNKERQKPCFVHSDSALTDSLSSLLNHLYPGEAEGVLEQLLNLIDAYQEYTPQSTDSLWDETDVMLITYGDSILSDNPPLQTLAMFMEERLKDCFSCLHILPFFPYSSDDGFSVIDYRKVNPELGEWEDIRRLSNDYRFMVDLVINHVSRQSNWFGDFVGDYSPGNQYFIEPDPEDDLSQVVRPRNTPLLTPVWTHTGKRHVWATFSPDQIDFNFRNPAVLVEMVKIVLLYMAQGASLIRLDAIAYLWKEPGTNCIHLPQTHTVVKIVRLIMGAVRSNSLLLTETNVPSEENLSYFGNGDEAQMVYQFPLPPLILHALNSGTSEYLVKWARGLPEYPEGCSVLNFTASHDGIGVRALEGIVPMDEVEELAESMCHFGGLISTRTLPDGFHSPYEINISLFDAMKGTRRGEDIWQIPRFICSQAIMLAMKGIPAVYVHSMFATGNDLDLVEETGRIRSINRKKWQLPALKEQLDNPTTTSAVVFENMKHMLRIRRGEPCFHPDNHQHILDELPSGLFGVLRADDNGRKVIALHNVTTGHQKINLDELDTFSESGTNIEVWSDLVASKTLPELGIKDQKELTLEPYQVVWLLKERPLR